MGENEFRNGCMDDVCHTWAPKPGYFQVVIINNNNVWFFSLAFRQTEH
jgi:hypothetical protein